MMSRNLRDDLQKLIRLATIVCLLVFISCVDSFSQIIPKVDFNVKFSIREHIFNDGFSEILLKIQNNECDTLIFVTRWGIDDHSELAYINRYYRERLTDNWDSGRTRHYFPHNFNAKRITLIPPQEAIEFSLGLETLDGVYLYYEIRTLCFLQKSRERGLQTFKTNTIYIPKKYRQIIALIPYYNALKETCSYIKPLRY